MSNGTKYSYPWADVKLLKEFIINNTKFLGKRGPVYTRASWFYRGEDNTHYPGDLVFLCENYGPNNGEAKHTLIISDGGTYDTAKICAHSINEKDFPLKTKVERSAYPRSVGFTLRYRY